MTGHVTELDQCSTLQVKPRASPSVTWDFFRVNLIFGTWLITGISALLYRLSGVLSRQWICSTCGISRHWSNNYSIQDRNAGVSHRHTMGREYSESLEIGRPCSYTCANPVLRSIKLEIWHHCFNITLTVHDIFLRKRYGFVKSSADFRFHVNNSKGMDKDNSTTSAPRSTPTRLICRTGGGNA